MSHQVHSTLTRSQLQEAAAQHPGQFEVAPGDKASTTHHPPPGEVHSLSKCPGSLREAAETGAGGSSAVFPSKSLGLLEHALHG